MKQYLLIGFVLLLPILLRAQLQTTTDPPQTVEQKWLVEKYNTFYKTKSNDAATQAFVKNFKDLVGVNAFCSLSTPEQHIKLKGSRINENNTLLEWDVISESSDVRYVLERRYSDPFGTFDSIGVLNAQFSNSALKNYQSFDFNSFSGRTYYRLRQVDVAGNTTDSKLAGVEGYNAKLNVFPNPTPSGSITVRFIKFDTAKKTQLLVKDVKGSTVYVTDNLYLNNSKTYKIVNLNLPRGTYFLQAANASGTGGTAFVIN